MTEPDILIWKIDELKEWQRVAWRRMASPSVTAFERGEIRNQIKQSDEGLRGCLAMMSERLRFRFRPVKEATESLVPPQPAANPSSVSMSHH
jgi:hypothetical protein